MVAARQGNVRFWHLADIGMSAVKGKADITCFTSVIFLSPRGFCSRATRRLLITRKINWSSLRHGRGSAQGVPIRQANATMRSRFAHFGRISGTMDS